MSQVDLDSTNRALGMKKTAEDEFWSTYLEAAREEDEWRPKDWDGNTGSILTFTGLFAATVAAFSVESYKSLTPDSGDQTVALLAQLLAVTTNGTSSSIPKTVPETALFVAPTVNVLANAFWLCSLSVSLVCALLATLIQQWSRNYSRDIRRRQTLDESIRGRAFNHIYVRMGVDRYGMDSILNWLVALVHLAVALFAAGLFLFLYPINSPVAMAVLGAFGLAYLAVSIIPIFDRSCPLRTPLTYAFAFAYWVILRTSRLPSISFFGNFVQSTWPRRMSLLDILSRQWNPPDCSSDDIEFFYHSSERFEYAWECTSRHMFNPAQITSLLASTMTLLEQSASAEDIQERIYHLAGDVGLVNQLSLHFSEVKPTRSSESSIAAVQMTVFVLQEILAREAISDSDYHRFRGIYVELGFMMARGDSDIATDDARYALVARFCLCHLRYSLLYLCQRASDPELVSLSDAETSPYPFLRGQHMIDFTGMHRNTLLLLLNSWQYNRIDAGWRDLSDADWQHNASSCLIPLHDSGCCRLRYGPRSHLAACNALTMISYLLDATDADRAFILDEQLLERFFLLQRGFPLMDWQFYLAMRRKADRHLPPSAEFLSTLCRAGLHAWLVPGSDFSTGPLSEPHLRFLTRTFEVGNGFTARRFTPLDVLRSLAQHVDFSKLRDVVDPNASPPAGTSPSHLHHDIELSGTSEARPWSSDSPNNKAATPNGRNTKDMQPFELDQKQLD